MTFSDFFLTVFFFSSIFICLVFRKFFLSILITIIFLLIFRFVWMPILFRAAGYYVTLDEEALAIYLYEQHLPASDCHKLIHFDRYAPPTNEKRASCIFQYAKISKDPTACRLLMPNPYSISCIGEVWHDLAPGIACTWYTNEIISCADENGKVYRTKNCYETQKNALLYDECRIQIALRRQEISICENLKNVELQSVCRVRVQAAIDYPEFRPIYSFEKNHVTSSVPPPTATQ
jgi:hypothetical protein